MNKVHYDCAFLPEPLLQKHVPTKGSKDRNYQKVLSFAWLKIKDVPTYFYAHEFQADPLLCLTLHTQSQLMSNIARRLFQPFLEQNQKVLFLEPSHADSKMQQDDLKAPTHIVKEQDEKERAEKEIIAIPFVYPSFGDYTYAHNVLIVVAIKNKTVYYYDPQGLTSDDPERVLALPTFDMRQDLLKLALDLFGEEGKVVENVAQHQSDPVNCGVFVMRALKRLKEGKSVEEALTFDPKQAASSVRTEIGLAYLDYLKSKNQQT